MKPEELELVRLRNNVDRIDEALVRLLNQRVVASIELGVIKNKLNKTLKDEERESQVREKIKAENQGQTLKDEDLLEIFHLIMTTCLSAQKTTDSSQ